MAKPLSQLTDEELLELLKQAPAVPNVNNIAPPSEPEDIMLDEMVPPPDFLPQGSPQQMQAGEKQLAKAAGIGAGLAGAASLPTMSGKSIFNALGLPGQTAGLAGGKLVSDVVSNAPGLYLAGKSGYDFYKEAQNPESKLATALQQELARAKDATLEDPSNLVNFPQTAERVGEITGGNVVPQTGVNLLSTLTKALTGGIKGLAGGAKKALDVTDTAIGDTRAALKPLADSKTLRLLGAIAGVSDKAPAASAISSLAFGKDITGAEAKPGSSIMELFEKPYNSMTEKEQDFVKSNWDTYLKYQGNQSGGVDWSKLPSTTQKSFNDLTQGFATLDSSEKDIKWAIENKDLATFIPAINNAMSANSVLMQQGVITDPEAGRLLQSVMNEAVTVSATGNPERISRFFNSDTWKSALNTIAVMKNSAVGRGEVLKKTHPELVPVFDRVGFPKPAQPGEMSNVGLQTANVMTKEVRDALAIAEAAKTQGLKTKENIQAAREAANVLKNSGSSALQFVGEGLEALLGKPHKGSDNKGNKDNKGNEDKPGKPKREKLF